VPVSLTPDSFTLLALETESDFSFSLADSSFLDLVVSSLGSFTLAASSF